MAPSNSQVPSSLKNFFLFSPCTVRQIEAFLRYGLYKFKVSIFQMFSRGINIMTKMVFESIEYLCEGFATHMDGMTGDPLFPL